MAKTAANNERKLGLKAEIVPKGSFMPDIAVDNKTVDLGRVNLKV